MVHLCEWLTLSQVSNGENNGKDKTRKKNEKSQNGGEGHFVKEDGQKGREKKEREKGKKIFVSL